MWSESEMNMATRTIRVEPGNDGKSVEADFFGFMAAGDHTYAGEMVAVRLPGAEFLTLLHWSRVEDEDILTQGAAYARATNTDEDE